MRGRERGGQTREAYVIRERERLEKASKGKRLGGSVGEREIEREREGGA